MGVLGGELALLMLFWTDENRADEQIVPVQLGHDADADAVLGLRIRPYRS